MSHPPRDKDLVGPWRTVHALIWLLGLALLAWSGRWWPGILVLIALSLVVEAVGRRRAPQAIQDSAPQPSEPAPQISTPATSGTGSSGPLAPEAIGREAWLPTTCPRCGGPTRANEVRWTGAASADCPFCGSNLPLKRT